jgi:IS5 family transposase
MLEVLVDAVPPIRQSWGPSRKRPGKLHADKAYDHRRCRRALTQRHIQPRIARRGLDSSTRLGRHR